MRGFDDGPNGMGFAGESEVAGYITGLTSYGGNAGTPFPLPRHFLTTPPVLTLLRIPRHDGRPSPRSPTRLDQRTHGRVRKPKRPHFFLAPL